MQPTPSQAPAFLLAAVATPGGVPYLSPGLIWPELIWAVPFAGLLLSIALFPIFAEHFWHRRMGLVVLGWSLALLLPQAIFFGPSVAIDSFWHAIVQDYVPFVALLLALYTVGGGILLTGGPGGTAFGNTAMLAFGVVFASIVGTTGMAMVLIHPLLRANAFRRRRVHIVVFFIVLVANAGGACSPLGDPPLYLGFLHGVPFLWPLRMLAAPLLVLAYPLLLLFYVIDRILLRGEPSPPATVRLRLHGSCNLLLLAVVIATVVIQGMWHPATLTWFGQTIGVERLVGIGIYLAVIGASLACTPPAVRAGNLFDWAPMAEIGKLFAAIFITIGPVLTMLDAGRSGPLAALLELTRDGSGQPLPAAYFWIAGGLSAFLDNAPTYLVFFQQAPAGDDQVLRAISAGSVFFGGLTYIGNAPNMMVRAIAAHRGVRMPGFFAYCGYAALLLLPVFALETALFFRS